jgi:CheY-specific phosphatase CheX
MMQIAREDIEVVVEDIWLSTLGLPARPAVSRDDDQLSGPTLDGLINITGDWQGTVVVQVTAALAARIASVMFRLNETPPTLEDIRDALGEVTNMAGGNIKALVPGTCHLSLPAVVEGKAYSIRVPSTEVVARAPFECEGMYGVVSLMAAGRRPRG